MGGGCSEVLRTRFTSFPSLVSKFSVNFLFRPGSDWGDATNCTLIQTKFLHESTDLKGLGVSHCLRVLVNVSFNRTLRLRYDEAAVDLSPEVSILQRLLFSLL